MGLTDFLYRCPFCGKDPLTDHGSRALCGGCGRAFEPGGGGTRIRVEEEGGDTREVRASVLSRRLRDLEGPLPRARGQAGSITYGSRVRARFAQREDPIWFRGRLLGFAERFGRVVDGRLEVTEDLLLLRSDPGKAEEEEGRTGAEGQSWSWKLTELGALQTASSSVQVSPPEGGVVLFRFPEDSVRRWDELLKALIRDAWREAGRGEIREFQPRIRAR